MKILNNLPYLIIAVLLIIIYFLYPQEPEIKTITKIETHTVTQIDTVFIEVEKPIFVELDIPEPIVEDSLQKYETQINDSLLQGTITTWTTGYISRQIFDYIPKFPKYITRTDSVFVDKTTTITRTHYPSGFYGGVETGALDGQFDISPKVYFLRQHYGIGYRYGLMTNSHHISFLMKF